MTELLVFGKSIFTIFKQHQRIPLAEQAGFMEKAFFDCHKSCLFQIYEWYEFNSEVFRETPSSLTTIEGREGTNHYLRIHKRSRAFGQGQTMKRIFRFTTTTLAREDLCHDRELLCCVVRPTAPPRQEHNHRYKKKTQKCHTHVRK